MTLKLTGPQVKRLERNLGAAKPTTRAMEKAKGELMTDYMRQYMKANGVTRMTVDLLHSQEYLKKLKKFLEIFLPDVLERMRKEAMK